MDNLGGDISIQGSEAWLKWRERGLGSSDIAAVIGESEWQTPYQLWLQKTGKATASEQGNWATERGTRLEPTARARASLLLGLDFKPQLFEHQVIRELRCSLDGWCEKTRTVLEIKVPGKEVFEEAKAGRVHEKYRPQLEWQVMVTGAERAYFYCIEVNKKDEITDDALVEYKSDPKLQYQLLMKAIEFQQRVERGLPPPLTERDYMEVNDAQATELFKELAQVKASLEAKEKEVKEIKEQLSRLTEGITSKYSHNRLKCGAVELVQVRRTGNVDWEKVARDRGFSMAELAEYRRKESTYWTIKVK